MMKFVKTNEFKNLNVGFALDEGYASENDTFFLFYGERSIWRKFIIFFFTKIYPDYVYIL